jgi:hypothetical protein
MPELKLAPALFYHGDGGRVGVVSQKTIISVVHNFREQCPLPDWSSNYYYYYYYYYYYLFTAIGFARGSSSPTLVQTKTIKQHYTVVQHNTIKRKQHNTIKRKQK